MRLVLVLTFICMAVVLPANAQVRVTHEMDVPCAIPCTRTAVFFIHGITGSVKTWRNRRTGNYFPTLLANDPALSQVIDVWSIDYDSLWESAPGIMNIGQILATELDPLIKKLDFRKIVFVAHSLGGNIARNYLLHIKNEYGHAALSRFRLLITLGTPMEGSTLAKWAMLASANQQFRSLVEIKKNDFLELLNTSFRSFAQKHLVNDCPSLETSAIYEDEGFPGIGLIVTKESAIAHATRSEGFKRNHLMLSRPANRQDLLYRWVRDEIAACVHGTGRCLDDLNAVHRCSFGDFY